MTLADHLSPDTDVAPHESFGPSSSQFSPSVGRHLGHGPVGWPLNSACGPTPARWPPRVVQGDVSGTDDQGRGAERREAHAHLVAADIVCTIWRRRERDLQRLVGDDAKQRADHHPSTGGGSHGSTQATT